MPRTKTTVSLTIAPEHLKAIDAARGDIPRSQYMVANSLPSANTPIPVELTRAQWLELSTGMGIACQRLVHRPDMEAMTAMLVAALKRAGVTP